MKKYNLKISRSKRRGGSMFGPSYGSSSNTWAKTIIIITAVFFVWELVATLLLQYVHKSLPNFIKNIFKLFTLAPPTPTKVPCLKTLITIWIANSLILMGLYGIVSSGSSPKTLSLILFLIGFTIRFILSRYLNWITEKSLSLTSCEEAESNDEVKDGTADAKEL